MNDKPENLSVKMIRPHLREIPQHPVPEGYSIRLFRRRDKKIWVAINNEADVYNHVTLDMFRHEFKGDVRGLKSRCFFLYKEGAGEVGTITAWYDQNYHGLEFGRIHWFAIVPKYQRQGLAKPMMTVAMNRLAELHSRAYLSTGTARLPAMKVYLDFGFVPDIMSDVDMERWEVIRKQLDHPLLREVSLWHRGR